MTKELGLTKTKPYIDLVKIAPRSHIYEIWEGVGAWVRNKNTNEGGTWPQPQVGYVVPGRLARQLSAPGDLERQAPLQVPQLMACHTAGSLAAPSVLAWQSVHAGLHCYADTFATPMNLAWQCGFDALVALAWPKGLFFEKNADGLSLKYCLKRIKKTKMTE